MLRTNNVIAISNRENKDIYVKWVTKKGKHIPIFGTGDPRWTRSQTDAWKKGSAKRKKLGIAKRKATIAAKATGGPGLTQEQKVEKAKSLRQDYIRAEKESSKVFWAHKAGSPERQKAEAKQDRLHKELQAARVDAGLDPHTGKSKKEVIEERAAKAAKIAAKKRTPAQRRQEREDLKTKGVTGEGEPGSLTNPTLQRENVTMQGFDGKYDVYKAGNQTVHAPAGPNSPKTVDRIVIKNAADMPKDASGKISSKITDIPLDVIISKGSGTHPQISAAFGSKRGANVSGYYDKPGNYRSNALIVVKQSGGRKDTYIHEIGHAVGGRHVATVIPGWGNASMSDKKKVTDYGETNYKEDFAESFACWSRGTILNRNKHPARVAALEDYFGSDRPPKRRGK